MNRVRWRAILWSVVFVGGVELLSDTYLDPYLPTLVDVLLLMFVVFLVVALFARRAFREVDRLEAALRRGNAELETRYTTERGLQQVSAAIADFADLDVVLQTTVDNARTLLRGDVALLVVTGPADAARVRAVSDPSGAIDATGGQPGDGVRRFIRRDRDAMLLQAPLRRGDTTIGTLAVGGPKANTVRIWDAETLSSLASQAAIAIEHDRLQAELRALAVRDERERIAGELHDGIAQVLGYVNTKSQAVGELLASGRVAEAQGQVAELAAAARSTYVDIREAILGLNSPVAPAGGLLTALRAYGQRFAEASKLVVRVEVVGAADSMHLEPAVDDEVFRIVREALTNVRKHAGASRVTIRLAIDARRLVIDVEDDGRGFDSAHLGAMAPDWPQAGIIGMRKRAASLGGTIHWEGAPSGGTIVRVVIPLEIGAMATAHSSGATTGSAR